MPEEFMDACQHLVGTMCPLSVNEDVTWKLTVPVLEEYPTETTLILEISLIGDLDRVVTCFEIPTVVL
jgi:Niemann-Pick C2 protein